MQTRTEGSFPRQRGSTRDNSTQRRNLCNGKRKRNGNGKRNALMISSRAVLINRALRLTNALIKPCQKYAHARARARFDSFDRFVVVCAMKKHARSDGCSVVLYLPLTEVPCRRKLILSEQFVISSTSNRDVSTIHQKLQQDQRSWTSRTYRYVSDK